MNKFYPLSGKPPKFYKYYEKMFNGFPLKEVFLHFSSILPQYKNKLENFLNDALDKTMAFSKIGDVALSTFNNNNNK